MWCHLQSRNPTRNLYTSEFGSRAHQRSREIKMNLLEQPDFGERPAIYFHLAEDAI